MKKFIIFVLALLFCFSGCTVVDNENDYTITIAETNKIAVVTIDGVQHEVSSSDVQSYPAKYLEQKISLIGEVDSIQGPYIYPEQVPYYYAYQVHIKDNLHGWYVLIDENDEIMSTIDIGDTIKAEGYVKEINGWSPEICGMDSDKNGKYFSSVKTKVSIVE